MASLAEYSDIFGTVPQGNISFIIRAGYVTWVGWDICKALIFTMSLMPNKFADRAEVL